jgi:protein involved in polysaccharide export with SLBB domain
VQIIPAGRSQQVKIPTEVTRSGQFQVTASLIGPDGVAWGAPVQLTVQSSAYGALTVILIIGAGGVLVIMVFLRIRQRLRGRRARIAAAGAAPHDRPTEGISAGPTPDSRTDRIIIPTPAGDAPHRPSEGAEKRQEFRS